MMKIYVSLCAFVLLVGGSFVGYHFYPDRVNAYLNAANDVRLQAKVFVVDVADQGVSAVVNTYNQSVDGILTTYDRGIDEIENKFLYVHDQAVITKNSVVGAMNAQYDEMTDSLAQGYEKALQTVDNTMASIKEDTVEYVSGVRDSVYEVMANLEGVFEKTKDTPVFVEVANNSIMMNDAHNPIVLNTVEPAYGEEVESEIPPAIKYEFEPDQLTIDVEAVLVPREKTVISSSRDGKIKAINFKNGDRFKKGDVLLEYHCDDLRAEWDAVHSEKRFARQKQLTTSRLFDLELASHLEKLQSSVENKQSTAKERAMESRLKDCVIKADYDGHVVKKMANVSEYTRTDRVLMEVASEGTLNMEFLLPSVWLRWVNVDAPLTLTLTETGRDYDAVINRVYGEVDPVSQSIQMRAELNDYDEPLLPGMSGQARISIDEIREAGVSGFLETQVH